MQYVDRSHAHGAIARQPSDELLHAGAGSGSLIVALAVLIPGLLPTRGLLGAITAVIALPLVAASLAVALAAAPLYGSWRLTTRARRRSTGKGEPIMHELPGIGTSHGEARHA